MACKIIILMSALVAVAKSGLAPVAAPVVAAAKVVDTEFDPNPQYTYAYDVQDSLTGDSKNQFETRDGDIVRGRYSLIEADGTRRIVDYTADPVNGFNAVVQREPAVVKAAVVAPAPVAKFVAPAPIVAPAPVVAAPVAKFVAAPAPVAKFIAAPAPYVAPAAKFIAPAPVIAKYAAAPYAQFVSAAPVAPVPAIAKVAAPLLASPFARYATPVGYPYAAKVVAPAPVAKFAAPLSYPASVAYTAPVAAPFAKFVSPFGAYNVL